MTHPRVSKTLQSCSFPGVRPSISIILIETNALIDYQEITRMCSYIEFYNIYSHIIYTSENANQFVPETKTFD